MTQTSQSAIGSSFPTISAFGGGYYLMGISGLGGATNTQLAYTLNPTGTWTMSAGNTGDNSAQMKGIAYANVNNTIPTWVMVAGSSAYHINSLSQDNWSRVSLGSGVTLKGLVYNTRLGKFIAVDDAGNWYSSSDGDDWTSAVQIASGAAFVPAALTYSQSTGVMVVVGSGGSEIYYCNTASGAPSWTAGSGTFTGFTNIRFTGVASSTST